MSIMRVIHGSVATQDKYSHLVNEKCKICDDVVAAAHAQQIKIGLDLDRSQPFHLTPGGPLSRTISVSPESKPLLPETAAERKEIPIGTGVLDYFSSALIEVARVSFKGNQQHNPGEPLHWARGKSTDQSDTIIRHFLERGRIDTDGMRHSAKLAWRALALLQEELEAEGAPISRGSK